MAVLHNKVDNRELKQKMLSETVPRTTISFYKYFRINDPTAFRNELYKALEKLNVFGRIYIAQEGINAQISVAEDRVAKFKETLDDFDAGLKDIRLNIAVDNDGKSFWVLRIKVREKIVADGIEDPDFDMSKAGKYLSAAEFNLMACDPETVVVDMRNHYEYEVGHFKEAIEIPSDTFRAQLPMAVEMLEANREKNIIMYCTGGIRCEKASAYLKQKGFGKVYHLEGGIIEYTRQARELELENQFVGKNFVFDERLGERISDDVIAQCHQCGTRSDSHTNCANQACHLLFIQCPDCAEKYDGCCSEECQRIMKLPAEERAALRNGVDKGAMIFNKSKDHPLRQHWNK